MDIHSRYQTISSIAEECISREELYNLVKSERTLTCYDGFEPSGRMHIAQGLIRTINTNKLTKCRCKFKFWIADWFAFMNHKMGGDLSKIQDVGKLMIETWKACGMDMTNVEFIWSSEGINRDPNKYWFMVLDIASKFNLNRVLKCTQIMGRENSDDLAASQILYPIMQCADIFYLGVDICSLGMDQRKVNMLAREYCDKVHKHKKPVILSHRMLMGLNGDEKMSKSNPDSAIFMDDNEMEVNRKIKKSFCPIGEVHGNPIMEYVEYIIFGMFDTFTVERKESHGGDLTYTYYSKLREDFKTQILHPADLKPAVAKYINKALKPVREYFENNKEAKRLQKKVKSYQVTR